MSMGQEAILNAQSSFACRGAVLVGSAVGSYTGIAALSALARGHREPAKDLALAGGIVGFIAGSLGMPRNPCS